MASFPGISFTLALNDDRVSKYFVDFLESQVASENIKFYFAAKEYAVTPQEDRIEQANVIYNQFIAETADERANLDDECIRLITERLNSGDVDLFEAAAVHIESLLKMDAFPRFKASPFYEKAVKVMVADTRVTRRLSDIVRPSDPPPLSRRAMSQSDMSISSKRKSQSVLEGYLLKKGKIGLWWKMRYFAVQLAEKLSYYRSNMDGDAIATVDLVNIIQIRQSNRVWPPIRPDLSGNGFILDCVVNGVRTEWSLCAQSADERDRWINGLEDRRRWSSFSSRITTQTNLM